MKTLITLSLATFLFLGTGCVVVRTKQPTREPRGWHKNPNNPHHPATTNPGHTKHKHQKVKNDHPKK